MIAYRLTRLIPDFCQVKYCYFTEKSPIIPRSVNHDQCSRWATMTVFVRWSSELAKSDERDYPRYVSAARLTRVVDNRDYPFEA